MAEALVNGVSTTLNGAITNSQTTITIASADTAKLPATGNYRLSVTDGTNTELMLVTAGQGTATLTVTRAAESYNGTATGYAFASGSTVAQVLTVAGLTSFATGSAGDKLLLDFKPSSDLTTGLALTANTWTDVPNSSQSFTVDDATATIEIIGSGAGVFGQTNTGNMAARLIVDADASKVVLLGAITRPTTVYMACPLSGEGAFAGLTVGSHTVKLQVQSTVADTFTLRPSTWGIYENLSIRVWQRPTVYKGGSVPSAQVNKTSNQSLANATWTAVTWDTEVFDTDNIHDTSSNTSRLTCRTPGKYLLSGVVEFSGLSTTYLAMQFAKNGSTSRVWGRYGRTDSTVTPIVPISDTIDLQVGDYVELMVFTGTGTGTIVGTNPNASFSMTRIGDVALGGPVKYAEQVLSSTAASVTFSSIPQTYRNARIMTETRSDQSGDQGLYMRFNGDTGSNYEHQELYSSGTTQATGTIRTAQTQLQIGNPPGTARTAGESSVSEVTIWNYAGSTFRKRCTSIENLQGTNVYFMSHSGRWANTAAITSITIFPQAGNFIAGSTFTLYLEP